MAKLIVTGSTRQQAIARARRALREFEIDGVASVLPFHRAVMEDPDFTENFAVHTRWIETDFAGRIAFAPRQLPVADEVMTRGWIELDGRRVRLGLPASLFGNLAIARAESPQQPIPESRSETIIEAPVSGIFHSWVKEAGGAVNQGEVLGVMEAMKMEVQVVAHRSGTLRQGVEKGEFIEEGQPVGEIG